MPSRRKTPTNRPPASDPLYRRIYAEVRRIPRGRVSSYGRVAKRVQGATARIVGYAMAALPPGSTVPWQRVVNHRGEVSPRKHGNGQMRQRLILEREGVTFDLRGRIDIRLYGWPRP